MTTKSYRFCILSIYRSSPLPLNLLSHLLDPGEHDLLPRILQQLPIWSSLSLHYQSKVPKTEI